MVATRRQKRTCIVTGGAGFLGRHLVDKLVLAGYAVTVFDIRESGDSRVATIVGDLRDEAQVLQALEGHELVFHVATLSLTTENAASNGRMYEVNVRGTANVIKACVHHQIRRLVYTSSASVVFDGQDMNNVDESAPYATKPLDYYLATKIEGEKLVLAANGVGGLTTIALRPSGIFGEWDAHSWPTIIEAARKGKMKCIIGNGRNLMEWTYAGNVADAHILAAEKLDSSPRVAGQAYFITNDEPVPFWTFMGDFLEPLGYGRPRIRLPFWLVFSVAAFYELVVIPLLSPFVKMGQSNFTRQRILIVSSNRQISCKKAKEELGYRPEVSLKEALECTIAHFEYLRADGEYKKVH